MSPNPNLHIKRSSPKPLELIYISYRGFITSTLRFVQFWRTDLFSDYNYKAGTVLIWTTVEPGTYFMCAALLTMRPLFRFVSQGIKDYGRSVSWKKGSHLSGDSSSNSKGSRLGLIRKESQIELAYSGVSVNSDTHLRELEPARLHYDDRKDSYNSLVEDGVESGEVVSGVATVRTVLQSDRWLVRTLK